VAVLAPTLRALVVAALVVAAILKLQTQIGPLLQTLLFTSASALAAAL